MTARNTALGPPIADDAEASEPAGVDGKNDKARTVIDPVRAMEKTVPASRTPLAMFGQPAKRSMDMRIREKTCEVEGRREARTTEPERADVRESDEVRLGSVAASLSRARVAKALSRVYRCRVQDAPLLFQDEIPRDRPRAAPALFLLPQLLLAATAALVGSG